MSQNQYWYFRYAIDSKGQKPAEEFFNSLSKQERLSFEALWRMVALQKQYHNDERFKKLNTSEGIWQFRAGDYRILSYQSGSCYVLTNGFRKDQNKTDQTLIDMAIKIKKQDMKRG
ncbi:MAG: type II toxin-antitoxin system RelE/ParE family toxin [Sedimentisphaerales bacterium]|nr:type II toxin-antitoxin system RelE/ParE family toxin [Sedimentisphaerales bacterium]